MRVVYLDAFWENDKRTNMDNTLVYKARAKACGAYVDLNLNTSAKTNV